MPITHEWIADPSTWTRSDLIRRLSARLFVPGTPSWGVHILIGKTYMDAPKVIQGACRCVYVSTAVWGFFEVLPAGEVGKT